MRHGDSSLPRPKIRAETCYQYFNPFGQYTGTPRRRGKNPVFRRGHHVQKKTFFLILHVQDFASSHGLFADDC